MNEVSRWPAVSAHEGSSVAAMIVERKLVALRKRLIEAQRGLIIHAAETDTIPTSSALRQIADLESAIVATETMIEEQRTLAN